LSKASVVLTALFAFATVRCDAQQGSSDRVFTAVSINGRPLPFVDSVMLDGSRQPVQEYRSWEVKLLSSDSGQIKTNYKDFMIARLPCETQREMRQNVLADSGIGMVLSSVTDTGRVGCDDLSVLTLTVPFGFRQRGDSIYIRFENEPEYPGFLHRDTLRVVVPGDPTKRVVAVRRETH